ncbi:hypothetical protein L484_016340 [Morus notabilis]|uniref:Uncharacterized protein n=1 Tax=Morus notabilis TaxID=981085 RepID=W9QLA3_9ROSA|nr:hypothetical protein L484_016340 [Morus notabilis]
MAALVANESLHDARAFWTLHALRHLSGDVRDVKAATMDNLSNLVVLLFENKLKSLFLNKLLPFL